MAEAGTKKARLEHLSTLIDEETKNWEKLGVSTQQFKADEFFLHVQGKALFKVMVDLLGVDEDEANIIMREEILREMTDMREHITPQIEKARLAAMQDAVTPKIVMPWEKPNGRKL